MKVKKKPVETGPQLVETDLESRIFTWYEIQAIELGQLKYEGRSTWVDMDDAKRVFKDAPAALMYFRDKQKEQVGRRADVEHARDNTLRGGETYFVEGLQAVTQEVGRLVLRTKHGQIIVRTK